MIWFGIAFFVSFLLFEWRMWRKSATPWGMEAEPSTASRGTRNQEQSVVSFLVPVWNGAHDIQPFMDAYLGLSWTNKELIMCAGGQDGSLQRAREYEQDGIFVFEQTPGMGKQRALRESFSRAKGSIIFLTDIDCRLTDKNVEAFVDHLNSMNADAVTGSICPPSEQRHNQFVLVQWAIQRIGDMLSPEIVHGIRGNNAAVRREAIERSRCLEVDVFSGTDYTMAKELERNNFTIRHLHECEMTSVYPENLKIYVRKQARWTRNVFLLGWRYRQRDEVLSVCVTAILPLLNAFLLVTGIWFPLAWEVFVILVLHTILSRFRYAKLSKIAVNIKGILLSMLGDFGAALVMSYQIITKQYIW